MQPPIDLQLLVTFVAVADESSFSRAATKLGIAKGTVSRAITELEALLGVELLHRTTHHVALSTAGAALYERTRSHLSALRSAVVDLPERDEDPSGLLRMTVPHDFSSLLLAPVLTAFTRRYPRVRFDVRTSGEHIDLVKEGYDLAIRISTGRLKDSSLTARKLGRTTAGFFAAPSYLARRGRPKQIGDDRHTWIVHPAVARRLQLEISAVQFVVEDFFLARDLAQAGVGITALPSFVASGYVRDGLVEELAIPGLDLGKADLVLLYPSSGQTPKKVTAFRDFLVEAMRSSPLGA